MASSFVRVVKLIISFFALLLCFNPLCSALQGNEDKADYYRFPFIKPASSYSSSPSSSSSSNGGDNGYDYIIIGGGTAGCPLAATLSQNFSVLVLERGGAPYTNPNVSYMQNFHISLADTSPTSASQFFISTDGVINSRAKVLGGGTCINAGFYTRASPSYVRRAGWDGDLVNESYPWVEKQVVFWPKLAPWQEALKDGLLEIGISPFNGYSYDHVYGTKVGGTTFEETGRRHTAADLLASANPRNLQVLIYASVQRIIFDTAGKRPKAIGVIFKDENGNEHRTFLSKNERSEVISSSGAIGSPHLLLLSGIGPEADLKKMNLPVILNNIHVGKGMADNPMNSIFIPTKKPVKQSLIQTVGITKMGVYVEASSGFGEKSDSIHCNHGMMSAEIGQLSTIPPSQRTPQAIADYMKRKKDLPHETFKGGFILQKIVRPLSKGQISLIDANIEENPSITFNYFSHPNDVKSCVDGIRTMQKIAHSKHYRDLTNDDVYSNEMLRNMTVDANVNLIPKHANSTKSLAQFCKDTVITIWHYHGGCHVGKVVDPRYKVLGVDGLRVIDGSTFRQSPGTNPQATVMMLGRYMGVKILRERLGRTAGV